MNSVGTVSARRNGRPKSTIAPHRLQIIQQAARLHATSALDPHIVQQPAAFPERAGMQGGLTCVGQLEADSGNGKAGNKQPVQEAESMPGSPVTSPMPIHCALGTKPSAQTSEPSEQQMVRPAA
jgi:hypothetical protein